MSFQDTNFLTENLDLKSVCLSVKENIEEHTAVNYRANTDEVTEEFEIKEKVVMTDNENKVRAACKDHARTGCLAHILHSSEQAELNRAFISSRTPFRPTKLSKTSANHSNPSLNLPNSSLNFPQTALPTTYPTAPTPLPVFSVKTSLQAVSRYKA